MQPAGHLQDFGLARGGELELALRARQLGRGSRRALGDGGGEAIAGNVGAETDPLGDHAARGGEQGLQRTRRAPVRCRRLPTATAYSAVDRSSRARRGIAGPKARPRMARPANVMTTARRRAKPQGVVIQAVSVEAPAAAP